MTSPTESVRLLTVDEAAAALRLSRRTVLRLIEREQLATVRIPGLRATRIRPEALEDLIADARGAARVPNDLPPAGSALGGIRAMDVQK